MPETCKSSGKPLGVGAVDGFASRKDKKAWDEASPKEKGEVLSKRTGGNPNYSLAKLRAEPKKGDESTRGKSFTSNRDRQGSLKGADGSSRGESGKRRESRPKTPTPSAPSSPARPNSSAPGSPARPSSAAASPKTSSMPARNPSSSMSRPQTAGSNRGSPTSSTAQRPHVVGDGRVSDPNHASRLYTDGKERDAKLSIAREEREAINLASRLPGTGYASDQAAAVSPTTTSPTLMTKKSHASKTQAAGFGGEARRPDMPWEQQHNLYRSDANKDVEPAGGPRNRDGRGPKEPEFQVEDPRVVMQKSREQAPDHTMHKGSKRADGGASPAFTSQPKTGAITPADKSSGVYPGLTGNKSLANSAAQVKKAATQRRQVPASERLYADAHSQQQSRFNAQQKKSQVELDSMAKEAWAPSAGSNFLKTGVRAQGTGVAGPKAAPQVGKTTLPKSGSHTWAGSYINTNSAGYQTMAISMQMTHGAGGKLSGKGEDNVGAHMLAGTATDTSCSIRKTYTGPATHSIVYEGVSNNGRLFEGKWWIEGCGANGTFSFSGQF